YYSDNDTAACANYTLSLHDALPIWTMDIVGAEADLVRRVAEEWLSQKRRSDFEKLHLAVQRQAIQIQLLKLGVAPDFDLTEQLRDRKSTRLNSSHVKISYAVFCLKK